MGKTKYVVVDTLHGLDVFRGKIVSVHRSLDAAFRSDGRLQRCVKRANGESAYLPTVVCATTVKVRVGDWARLDETDVVEVAPV